jgi:YtcA family
MAMIEALFLENGGSPHHRAPSIDVFGSYFPAWLIALAAGVALTIVASAAGHLLGIKPPGLLSPLLYVSLILIFSISVWFWFFAI